MKKLLAIALLFVLCTSCWSEENDPQPAAEESDPLMQPYVPIEGTDGNNSHGTPPPPPPPGVG